MVRLLVEDGDIVIASLGKVDGSTEAKNAGSYNDDWVLLGYRRSGHFCLMIQVSVALSGDQATDWDWKPLRRPPRDWIFWGKDVNKVTYS